MLLEVLVFISLPLSPVISVVVSVASIGARLLRRVWRDGLGLAWPAEWIGRLLKIPTSPSLLPSVILAVPLLSVIWILGVWNIQILRRPS